MRVFVIEVIGNYLRGGCAREFNQNCYIMSPPVSREFEPARERCDPVSLGTRYRKR